MQGHVGAGRVSSAKDKAEFIKSASMRYVDGLLKAVSSSEDDDTVCEIAIATGVDIAEQHWDELKRRGHV